MAALMLQVLPGSYANISKNIFLISAKTFEKNILCKEYYISHHDDKLSVLLISKNHNTLIGDPNELLWQMDALCFGNQHVDCSYTLFPYQFSRKITVKGGQVSDNLQRAV